ARLQAGAREALFDLPEDKTRHRDLAYIRDDDLEREDDREQQPARPQQERADRARAGVGAAATKGQPARKRHGTSGRRGGRPIIDAFRAAFRSAPPGAVVGFPPADPDRGNRRSAPRRHPEAPDPPRTS